MTPEEWARAAQVGGPAEKAVLFALVALRVGHDRVTCSLAQIARTVCAPDSTTRHLIAGLVRTGFVTQNRTRGGTPGLDLQLCYDVLFPVTQPQHALSMSAGGHSGVRLVKSEQCPPADIASSSNTPFQCPPTDIAQQMTVAHFEGQCPPVDIETPLPDKPVLSVFSESETGMNVTPPSPSPSPSSPPISPPSSPSPSSTPIPAAAKKPKTPKFQRQFHDFDADQRALMHTRWDGPLGGVSNVDDQIELALSHDQVEKYTHIPQYVNNWLRRAATEFAQAHRAPRNGFGSNGHSRPAVHEGLMATRSIRDDDE